MFNETFWMIMGIFFWVLVALIVVVFFAEMYVKLTYFKWDREDRENRIIEYKVGEIVDEKINPGGGIEKVEN